MSVSYYFSCACGPRGGRIIFNVEGAWEIFVVVLWALVGRFANLLHQNATWRLRRIVSELFVAAFVGVIVLSGARIALHVTSDWLVVLGGMAGWCGPKCLNAALAAIGKRTGVNLDEPKEGEKK